MFQSQTTVHLTINNCKSFDSLSVVIFKFALRCVLQPWNVARVCSMMSLCHETAVHRKRRKVTKWTLCNLFYLYTRISARLTAFGLCAKLCANHLPPLWHLFVSPWLLVFLFFFLFSFFASRPPGENLNAISVPFNPAAGCEIITLCLRWKRFILLFFFFSKCEHHNTDFPLHRNVHTVCAVQLWLDVQVQTSTGCNGEMMTEQSSLLIPGAQTCGIDLLIQSSSRLERGETNPISIFLQIKHIDDRQWAQLLQNKIPVWYPAQYYIKHSYTVLPTATELFRQSDFLTT